MSRSYGLESGEPAGQRALPQADYLPLAALVKEPPCSIGLGLCGSLTNDWVWGHRDPLCRRA
jgi:hypothetical protein